MKKYLTILMTAVLTVFASCSKDDDGGNGGSLIPPTQEETMQEAFADNENTGGGFSFTAGAAWTATVTEIQAPDVTPAAMSVKSVTRAAEREGNNVVWLRLYLGDRETYSGPAGTTTLRIEIDQNYTGERREATITIVSGNDSFTVTVVQEGTKQDGSNNDAPVPVTDIALSKTELSLEAGQTATLTATVTPDNATIKSVTWSSSNPQVADVHPLTGLVTAVAEGTATVMATSSSNKEVSASCSVTVGGNEPVVPDPSNYAFVSRIERKVTYWDQLTTSEHDEEDATYAFEYDGQDRVSSYTVDIRPANDSDGSSKLVSKIDYSIPGRLRIEDRWSDAETKTYDVLLNDKGYISQGKSHPYSHDEDSYEFYTYGIEYNDEDRISRVAYSDEWSTFVYKDGVLSGGTYFDGYETSETSGFEQYFTQIPNNKLNLDINMLFLSTMLSEEPEDGDVPGRLGRLALLRLAGRGMDRYITIFAAWNDDEDVAVDVGGYPEPNVTIQKSYEYVTYDENAETPLDYVLNEDGTVASVTARASVVRIKHEYDIVVGNEPVHPGYPEAGYKYEIKNSKDTELGRGTNSIAYTFTYR